MNKEEKELLLKDLCARLPYGIQIHIDFNKIGHIVGDATLKTITCITGQFFDFTDFKQDFKNGDCCSISGFSSNKLLCIEEFKPYLRSLSSMTEEEKKEYAEIVVKSQDCSYENNESATTMVNDWYLSKGFDVRGLIPKGLALEAPKDMYKL